VAFTNILIASQANKAAWGVLCLSYEVKTSETPDLMCVDGITMVLVGWACDSGGDFPIYLQVDEMSRAKQKFALKTVFYSLKKNGYRLETK